jgi:hypothetical protein
MAAAYVNKYLDDWMRVRENKRISDIGKGDEYPNRKRQTKMTLSAEGKI